MIRARRLATSAAVIAAVLTTGLAALAGGDADATATTGNNWLAIGFARCPTHTVVVAWYPKGDEGRGTPDTLPQGGLALEKPPDPRRAHATIWRTGGFAEDNWLFYAERPHRQGKGWSPEYSVPDSSPCVGPAPATQGALSKAIAHARSAHGATALRCHFKGYWAAGIGSVLEVIQGRRDTPRLRATLARRHPTIRWDTSRCKRIALP